MNTNIVKRIQKATNTPDLATVLTSLPSSDFNSLMMEVFSQRVEQITPSDLFRHYTQNRFVKPAHVDFVSLLAFELNLLKKAQVSGFEPLELSPVSPVGACSVVATVNQNKVLSALRGTEVMADATNSLALESVSRRKVANFDQNCIRLCTVHRHLRTPYVKPPFTAHFKIFCMVTGGKDTGSLQFEKQHVVEHLRLITDYLKTFNAVESISINLKSTQQSNPSFEVLCEEVQKQILGVSFAQESINQGYYQTIQFKVQVKIKGNTYEIADGGLVDWSKKLSDNHKERMVTSGIGLELLFKLLS